MRYIYLFTSPSTRQYIGKSTVNLSEKKRMYMAATSRNGNSRLIINALRKYGWENMQFTVIDQNDEWTSLELNEHECFYIKKYNTHFLEGSGYNMTFGGDGFDSDTARIHALQYHEDMTEEQRKTRSKNCSNGQKNRFRDSPESDETKLRKKKAHQGKYIIESPDGRVWETDIGLKEFAESHKEELGVGYWKLFNAYRKNYNGVQITHVRKNINLWQVTRIDK